MATEATLLAEDPVAEVTTESLQGDATGRRELEDLWLGIVGAGKLGTTIARAAIAAVRLILTSPDEFTAERYADFARSVLRR